MIEANESWIPYHCDAYTPDQVFWGSYPFVDPSALPPDDGEAPDELWIDRATMTPAQTSATIASLRQVAANLLAHADALASTL